jgi:hypothetical protein
MCYRHPQLDEEQTARQMSRLVSKNTYRFLIASLFLRIITAVLYHHDTVVHKEG